MFKTEGMNEYKRWWTIGLQGKPTEVPPGNDLLAWEALHHGQLLFENVTLREMLREIAKEEHREIWECKT
ncbi:MAG: hypothetical protein ACXABY_19105 [Candidatus Thorarchaeota archaeon]|jgi:hypothetical protein